MTNDELHEMLEFFAELIEMNNKVLEMQAARIEQLEAENRRLKAGH